jgi:hypothetical protein
VLLLALLMQGVAIAQETVEVDPIRCWWRTSVGAVRVGETFSVVLTCAVLQNEGVQVVPDQSRLDASVIQMAPFEVVGGEHPGDLYAPNRRFFQYEYRLRIINPDVIGRDVRIPDPQIRYRVNSTVAANTALQGRDHTYLMPSQSVRVLSLVPADAPDIRDTAGAAFGAAEQLTFRANALRIGAYTAMVLGGILLIFGLGRAVVRTRSQKTVEARGLAPATILRAAARELTDVQGQAAGGWTSDLVARALAATRIVTALATGRTIHQERGAVEAGEGRVIVRGWRGRTTAVSASATAQDVEDDDLRGALAAFTRVHYSRDAPLENSALDETVTRVSSAARLLRATHAGPKAYLRRWLPPVQAEQRA